MSSNDDDAIVVSGSESSDTNVKRKRKRRATSVQTARSQSKPSLVEEKPKPKRGRPPKNKSKTDDAKGVTPRKSQGSLGPMIVNVVDSTSFDINDEKSRFEAFAFFEKNGYARWKSVASPETIKTLIDNFFDFCCKF